MANVRSSTGDDEFRTYMNDFESYLHNIGSNARTASPEQMTSSVETGEQGDWNNDTRNTSDSCNIAQFEIDQPYTSDLMSGHDRQLDEQYDSYTYGQQTEAAANDDYFYNSQQVESDDNQQQQQQYSGYEAESDYVNSDIVNEPNSYANVNAGSDDYVPQVITVAEGLEDVVPESQTENHVTDNNDDNDDDDDDDETDDYIEHEYLIAQHTPKQQQQADTLENDVTPAVDSDDRSTDDNGEGITDSLTEGEYYVSQQTTHEVQQTYYETAENGHYVTSDVHQYYEEESALLKVDDDEHLKHDATTRIEDANTPVLTDDVQQYSQYVQEQDEESQFTEQTTENTYYDDSLHSNNMTDQNSKSVSADEYIDNEQHLQQQNKQVKFSVNDDHQQRVNVTHDDDDDDNEKASVNDNATVDNHHHHQQQQQHDDDGNEQRPSERGRIRDLLAHWRQFEQQVSRSSLTDSRSGAGSSGYHTRSRSCGPVTRRHHITTYDNSRSNDDSAAPYNVNDNRDDDDDVDNMNNLMTSTDRVYRRAAILAKFENLDAEAHKSAITTKKREFKWSVKEPTTLGRPVGLHCS